MVYLKVASAVKNCISVFVASNSNDVKDTGKATAEVYAEEPFPYKVREKDAIQRHLDADDKMNKIDMKIKYYDVMLKFLEEIIRAVSNRTYQIKNAIEWNKFQAGFG